MRGKCMHSLAENKDEDKSSLLKLVDLEKARRIISSLHEGNKIPSHEVIWALKITGDISS